MEFITILVCLWAIGLEIALQKRSSDLKALIAAVNDVAVGKAKVCRKNDKTSIIYINKEKN